MIQRKADIERAIIADWGDTPQGKLCQIILDWLDQHQDLNHMSLTLTLVLQEVVNQKTNPSEIFEALNYLSGERVNILRAEYELEDENGNSFELPRSELSEAYKTGFLIHPQTGERLDDFKEHVIPFFKPRID